MKYFRRKLRQGEFILPLLQKLVNKKFYQGVLRRMNKRYAKNLIRYSAEMALSGAMTVVSPPRPGARRGETPTNLLSRSEIRRLPSGFGGTDGIVDMNNTPTSDQDETPHCVDYGSIGTLETMAIIKYGDYISFDRELYAEALWEAGIMTSKGAYLHEVMEWFHEKGIEDQQGRKYKVGKPVPVDKVDIPILMDKGFPVIVLGFWGWPYHNLDYMWLPKTLSSGFSHCTFLNMVYPPKTIHLPSGVDNVETLYANETSWGAYFGRHKLNKGVATGQLYLRESDLDKIFAPHIFTSIERIE